MLGWLVDDPGPGRFLQRLTIGLVRHDDNTYQRVAAVLARHPRRALRSLVLGDFGYEDCELNWTDLGDLSELWAATPNLRSLTLRGGHMRLGPIHLPRLEQLDTITGGLDPVSLGHLAAAAWPELVELALQIGVGHEGAATTADGLEPLFDAARVPKLRRLGLTNCEFTDTLCERLAGSKLLAQLEELDLSMGSISQAGFDAIEAQRDRFAHLKKLTVGPIFDDDRAEVGRPPVLAGAPVQVVWDDRYGPVYE